MVECTSLARLQSRPQQSPVPALKLCCLSRGLQPGQQAAAWPGFGRCICPCSYHKGARGTVTPQHLWCCASRLGVWQLMQSAPPIPFFQAVGMSVNAGRAQGLACGAPAGVSGCAQARAPASRPPLQQQLPATPAPRPAPGRPPPRLPPWRSGRSRRPAPPSSHPGRAASASHSPSADTMKKTFLPCSHAESKVRCSRHHGCFGTALHRSFWYINNSSLGLP